MKKFAAFFIDNIRKIKHYIYTFLLKRQLMSYGNYIGAAKLIKISRKAKVNVGSHCGFNGMTISGQGGGMHWQLLPFWNKYFNNARKP